MHDISFRMRQEGPHTVRSSQEGKKELSQTDLICNLKKPIEMDACIRHYSMYNVQYLVRTVVKEESERGDSTTVGRGT